MKNPTTRQLPRHRAARKFLLESLEPRTLFSFTVAGNAALITDGDSTPAQSDYTDYGYIGVSSGSVYRAYTIQNTGVGTVNLTGSPRVAISGANAADFTVTTLPTSSLTTGASTTFIITFNPSAAGVRTANVSISNDDLQGAFDFSIRGTGLNTTTTASGLQVATVTSGTGLTASTGQTVRVNYSGFLVDGLKFNSSLLPDGSPFDFTIGFSSVIAGWQEGIPGMKIGERRVLIIPPALGYGSTGKDNIPPNATLIFEIDLLAIGANIVVKGNNVPLVDGDVTPSTSDFTDFGVLLPNDSLTRTFVVTSGGPGSLSFTSTPRVLLAGANTSQFILTPLVIDGSGTFATYTVKYQPTVEGLALATITIPSNDLDNPNFTYTIQGRLDKAPTVVPVSRSFFQDTTFTFAPSHFSAGFTDPDVGDALAKIKITSLPVGSLQLSGVPVTLNQEIPVASIANLTYTPVAAYVGPDSFTWTGSDGYRYAVASVNMNLNVLTTDHTAPTATLVVRDPDIVGTAVQIQIKFTDNLSLDSSTFAIPNAVYVVASNGFSGTAVLLSVNLAGDGASRTATYQLTAPGGTWDSPDAGRYDIYLAANTFADTGGNFVAGGYYGRFYYSPDPFFSERYYDTHYTDITAALSAGAILSGYSHFQAAGQYEGRNPSPFFDEAYYRSTNPDVNAAVVSGALISGFQHFRLYGAPENRRPSLIFDALWYRYSDSAVAAAVASGYFSSSLEHYMRFGQYENRAPSYYFDPAYYLTSNPDVAAAVASGFFASAFDHFLNFGSAEHRQPVDIYNETYYLAQNPDIASAVSLGMLSSGYQHFLLFGQYENRRPSANFDPLFYLATYPQVAAWVSGGSDRSAFFHYIVWGRNEGRLTHA